MALAAVIDRSDLQLFLRLTACAGLAFLIIALVWRHDPMIVADMLRDRAAWGGKPFYLGAISQIGIMTWSVGASVALFATNLARQQQQADDRLSFLHWAGILTAVMCLDDAFQFHEHVAPKYLYTDQKTVLGLYGISALLLGWRFRRFLLARPLLPTAVALAFGGSVSIDQTEGLGLWSSVTLQMMVEDSLKQFGILLWAGFLIDQALGLVSVRDKAGMITPASAPLSLTSLPTA